MRVRDVGHSQCVYHFIQFQINESNVSWNLEKVVSSMLVVLLLCFPSSGFLRVSDLTITLCVLWALIDSLLQCLENALDFLVRCVLVSMGYFKNVRSLILKIHWVELLIKGEVFRNTVLLTSWLLSQQPNAKKSNSAICVAQFFSGLANHRTGLHCAGPESLCFGRIFWNKAS